MEKSENKQENQIACPKELKWLKAVYEFLPYEIFKKSKLAPYEECLKRAVK